MELQIASWILMCWLLAAAWIVDPDYALWAGVMVMIWWATWINRIPRWPPGPRRFLVYMIFLGTVFMFAFFIAQWQAWFVLIEILVLWVVERFMGGRVRDSVSR